MAVKHSPIRRAAIEALVSGVEPVRIAEPITLSPARKALIERLAAQARPIKVNPLKAI